MASALGAAIDGKLEPPPDESWFPYRLEAVVDDYLDAFTGVG